MKKLLCSLFLSASLPALASDFETLGRSDTWLKLLHYQKNSFGEISSAIHSPEFFLDATGRHDPVAELNATIAAMQQPVIPGQENEHAKCRFPARRMWLETSLAKFSPSFSKIQCPTFEEWGNPKQIGSVSLVLANGYLGNPASYYGHLFLKFNQEKEGKSYLVDQTANFGAIDVKGDNPVVYIFKALVGGYDGGFSQADFFFHDANYTENELRDLWEYRLNLSPKEVEFLLAHTWEIQQKRFTYFFFHDNCAFRIGELLEIVDGIKAIPDDAPWVIPLSVLQMLAIETRNGEPVVKQKIVHPSRQSRLYRRYEALDEPSKRQIHALIEGNAELSHEPFTTLPVTQQQAILDTVLDYYQFKGGEVSANGEKQMPVQYHQALLARLQLPSSNEQLDKHVTAPPDTAHRPGWIQFAAGSQDGSIAVQTLRIRPAYYDVLDGGAAQAPFSGLSMGDLTLEFTPQKLQIKRLDIVSVDSISPSVTGLPGDKGKGWRVRIGLEKEQIACTDECLLSRLQGDYIWAPVSGSSKIFGSFNLGGALQTHSARDGHGFVRSGMGLTARLSQDVSFRFSKEYRFPFEANSHAYSTSTLETRVQVSKANDVRLLWEKDLASRLTLGVGLYW